MCGLWASVGLDVPRAAIEVVAHRGPDGEGWWEERSDIGRRVVLAHRRLAILDLHERAAQPMLHGPSGCRIVYNGEVYNFKELRRELEAKGHEFHTASDTEVVLAAYAEWGEDCLARFNGMFAFVIHDPNRQRFFAARDRFGVKPLYVAKVGGGLAFASELKQILQLPGVRRVLNREAAADYLIATLFGHRRETLLEGIECVPAGHSLSVATQGTGEQCPEPRRWYELKPSTGAGLTDEEAIAGFKSLLVDAVRLRLRSDVPVGTCLSGGLDSSLLVGFVNAAGAKDQHTFSSVIALAGFDEAPFIDSVVEKYAVNAHRLTPDPQRLPGLFDRIVWHQEVPVASLSVFSQWSVYERVGRSPVKVMLDGQGADEVLGGYLPMLPAHIGALLASGRLLEALSEAWRQRSVHALSLSEQISGALAVILPDAARAMLRTLARKNGPPSWFARDGWDGVAGYRPIEQASLQALGHRPLSLQDLCQLQLEATSLPRLLHYADRNSMAHGVEARLPYLDYRGVEFVFSLGDRLRTRGGLSKWILREAGRGALPETVRLRRDKLGFPAPQSFWLRTVLRGWFEDEFRRLLKKFPGLLDEGQMARMLQSYVNSNSHSPIVWRAFSFLKWLEVFAVESS